MHSGQPVGRPWEPDRSFTWPNSLPGAIRPRIVPPICLLVLLVATCKQWTVAAQRPMQFIPAGIETEIPAGLAFRGEGLIEALTDPDGSTAVIRGDLDLDPTSWRKAFATTGGSAAIGANKSHVNFTISGELVCPPASDCSALDDDSSSGQGSLNFNRMVSAIRVEKGGLLQLQNVVLYDVAALSDYAYSPEQPYRLMLVGSDMWPTIGLAPGLASDWSTNNALDLSCEEHNSLALFSFQQLRGKDVVVQYNSTAGRVPGRLEYTVNVLNGSNNATLGAASFFLQNVTFNCLPGVAGQAATAGLPAPQLAAAIAVPVGLAVLAAVVCCVLCHKRCRTTSGVSSCDKDVEVAAEDLARTCSSNPLYDGHRLGNGDQPSAVGAGHKLVSLQQQQQQQQQRQLPDNGSLKAAILEAAAVAVPAHFVSRSRCSESSGLDHALTASRSIISDKLVAAASCPPSFFSDGRGQQQLQSQEQQVNLLAQDSPASSTYRSTCDDVQVVVGQPDDLPSRCVDIPLPAVPAAACPVTSGAASAGCTAGAADDSGVWPCSSADGSAGLHTAASGGSGAGRPGGSCNGTSGGSGTASVGSTASRSGGAGGVPAILKARSDMAVLRDLKIGPLLGRGSYGSVYKGRWKSVTVAVKVIEHRSASPGTASSTAGKRMMVDRETAVAASMAHPNVVQTYHISTMSATQRAAMTSNLQGKDVVSSRDVQHGSRQSGAASAFADGDDSDSSSSSDDERRDPLETWMIMEFCEKGSLEKAMKLGQFTSAVGEPNMIGIYKALLDTASGLDYLHSIGVVHGDLKTANVLLKGSARDVRGFACKITDFGLSRVLDPDATHISTRTHGTITYMPREMLLTGHISRATDIYSFGLMMWELYTSSCVFEEGMSIGQMFYMIAYDNWRPHVPEDCPPGYAALMRACWDVDPDQRPTALQVLRSLQKLYLAEKGSASAGRGSPAASSPTREGGARSAYQDWPKLPASASPNSSPEGSDAHVAASVGSGQAAGPGQQVLAISSGPSSGPASLQGSGNVQQGLQEQHTQLHQLPPQPPHDISSLGAGTGQPCQQARGISTVATTAVQSGPADARSGMETRARAGVTHSHAAQPQQVSSDTAGPSRGSSGSYQPWAQAVLQEQQQKDQQQQSRAPAEGEGSRTRQKARAFGSVFMADQHAQQLHNKAIAAVDGAARSGQDVAQLAPQHRHQQMHDDALLSGRDQQQGTLLPEQQQFQPCAPQHQQQQQWEDSALPSTAGAGHAVQVSSVPPINGGVVIGHHQQQQGKMLQPVQQPRSVSTFWAAISRSMHHHSLASPVATPQAAAHRGAEDADAPSQLHGTGDSTVTDGPVSSPGGSCVEAASHHQQQQDKLAGDRLGFGCTRRQRAFGSLFYGDAHQPDYTHAAGLAAAARASKAAGIPESSAVEAALSPARQQNTAISGTLAEHDQHLQIEAAAVEGAGAGADTHTSDRHCSGDPAQQEVQHQHAVMPGQLQQQEQQNALLSEQQHQLHGPLSQEEQISRWSAMQRARRQQQQEQHDAMLLRQLSTYYRIGSSSDAQPAVDNEQLPSESLFQADEIPSTSTCGSQYLSSGANTLCHDADLHSLPSRHSNTELWSVSSSKNREQQDALQQQSQLIADSGHPNHSAAAAAQSFLAALELVTGFPAAASASDPGTNPDQLPYHYQQRPLMAQHIADVNAPNVQSVPVQGSGVVSGSLFGP